MLPAPTTTAISTPRPCTRASSPATDFTRSGSVPEASEPIRDSPESFRSTRLKTGSAMGGASLLADGEARKAADDDVLAGLARQLGPQLLDRLAVVLVRIDVRLLEQHDLLEPLAQLALGRLLTRVLGDVVELLGVDPHLGLPGVRGHVLGRDPLRLGRSRDVQRDVLGEGDELLVGGHEVGVAVDLDEHADLAVGVDVGLDGPLGCLSARQLLDLLPELDAQELDGLVDVAVGLLERGLAIHHPGARAFAQGLDVLGGNGGGLSHRWEPPRWSRWSRRRVPRRAVALPGRGSGPP